MTTVSGSSVRGRRVLHTFTANGQSPWLTLGSVQHLLAATCVLFLTGEWGSGSATLEIATTADGDDALTLGDAITDDGKFELTGYPEDLFFRVSLSGATSPDLELVGL